MGDERLSGKQQGESRHAAPARSSGKKSGEGKGRKQRINDIGRALRTVYDDTLRESVPDDIASLLGKLS